MGPSKMRCPKSFRREEVSDREKIDFLAEKLGTLKQRTRMYSYISDIRYKFDSVGNVIEVSERVPGGNNQWRPVK